MVMASDIKINLNSVHIPLTALAWQSWKVLVVLILSMFFTVGAAGLVLLVAYNSRQTENDKLRENYYKQCYAQFALATQGMSPDTGFQMCRAQARLEYPLD